jgi:hypothetical protein
MDVEAIIVSKNIMDPFIIVVLRMIAESKKANMQVTTLKSNKVSSSIFIEIINLQPPNLSMKVNKVTPPISSLEVTKVPSLLSTSQDVSSSSCTHHEVFLPFIINYFINLLSDIDESDEEFPLFQIILSLMSTYKLLGILHNLNLRPNF